ncbi:MAG: TPM domain-containing protein [Thermoanaerobaculia bacterium]
MPKLDELFGESATERIRAAVNEAEGRTSGEIVPYVVGSSDTYAGSYWLSALFGALAGPLAAWAAYERLELWGLPALAWLVGPAFAGAVAGWVAARLVPAWRRWLAGAETLERRTRRRAAVAFLEEEVFKTRDRTGILIFLSLFEHRVVVLGDEGINRKVEQPEWEGIVEGIVSGIRTGRPADALVEAIGRCGELLQELGFEIAPDDTDELSDELRRRDS